VRQVDEAIRVTLVTETRPGCHLCEHAREVLARLGRTWPLVVEEVAWESPEGRALVARDGIPFQPVVYIDGVCVGYGRLSEGRLRRELERRRSS